MFLMEWVTKKFKNWNPSFLVTIKKQQYYKRVKWVKLIHISFN